MSDVQVKVRIPAELHEKIAAAAEKNKRSINAEINARIEHTLSDKTISGVSMSDLFVMMEELKDMVRTGQYREFSMSAQRGAEVLDPPPAPKRKAKT